MNLETRSSHVRIDLGGSLSNQSRASPSREKVKSKSFIEVFGTSGCLNVEVTLLKNRRQSSDPTLANRRSLRRHTSQYITSSKGKEKAPELSLLDHGHETNDCRELRHQIEEAVRLGQLSHLVNGIKKGKTRVTNTQQGIKKENKQTTPVEAPILMISKQNQKRKSVEEPINRLREITFPPVLGSNNSSDPVIIKACIFEIELKPALQSLKVDLRVPLVGFSREHSWPLGEVPLEVTIGDGSLTRTKVLNFIIIRSNSLHNLLLGRTTMQRMGIVVSTIHRVIKFHTPKGIGTVLSTYEPPERDERKKKPKATCLEIAKNVLSYEDAEERIIVNTKYPEQTIAIGKQFQPI
ncbi:hypothetical protein Tco_0744617 [Tanacetum coccineum]